MRLLEQNDTEKKIRIKKELQLHIETQTKHTQKKNRRQNIHSNLFFFFIKSKMITFVDKIKTN